MKKKLLIAVAAAALSICNVAPAMAEGWQKDNNGWWYLYDNGSYPVSSWQRIGGKDYYFDAYGYLAKGWVQRGNEWRYFLEDGTVATEWVKDNGKWYYFGTDGSMMKGFLEYKNDTYYLNEDGSMAVGQKEIDGQIWFFESDGTAKKDSRSFVKNGVRYRYRDNILERYNTVYKSWEAVPGAQDAMDMIKDKLMTDYENRVYSSVRAFEEDVKLKLGKYLSQDEIEEFVMDVTWE